MVTVESNITRPKIHTLVLIFLVSLVVLPASASAALSAASASSNSVTISWTAPGDDGNQGQAAEYDIRYATFLINEQNFSSATPASNIPLPQMAGSSETLTISGLSQGTTYYVAIKAADEVPNWSVLSNVVVVATDNETDPPSDVANLLASSPTNSSAILSWTAPGDDSTVGTASVYDLRFSTNLIDNNNWNSASQVSAEPNPSVAGSSESMVVGSLSPNVTYYFAIKTSDEVGNWSGISNITNITTASEQTAPENIATLQVQSPSDTSLTLSWTAPGDDGSTGTASQYDIRYSTSSINNGNFNSATQVSSLPSPQIAGSAELFEVTGLNPSTTYYFAIKTADEVPNWSGLSNVASGSTGEEQTPPADISTLASSIVTDSSISFTWTAPGDDGNSGTATVYDIRYAIATINGANWDSAIVIADPPTPALAGTEQSYTLSGLEQGKGYFFAIKTADEIPNWSSLSNILAVSTLGDNSAPAAINDLSGGAGQAVGSIEIGWTAPGDDGLFGQSNAYLIKLSMDSLYEENWDSAFVFASPPSPLESGSQQTAIITGLLPGQQYFVGIKSIDDALNFSPLSNVVTAEAKFDLSLDIDDEFAELPADYQLSQNYPNPFNPSTTIEYSVPQNSFVTLSVYDISGRETTTLVSETKSAGTYAAVWDGKDKNNNQVASGIYVYRISTEGHSESKKMVLVK